MADYRGEKRSNPQGGKRQGGYRKDHRGGSGEGRGGSGYGKRGSGGPDGERRYGDRDSQGRGDRSYGDRDSRGRGSSGRDGEHRENRGGYGSRRDGDFGRGGSGERRYGDRNSQGRTERRYGDRDSGGRGSGGRDGERRHDRGGSGGGQGRDRDRRQGDRPYRDRQFGDKQYGERRYGDRDSRGRDGDRRKGGYSDRDGGRSQGGRSYGGGQGGGKGRSFDRRDEGGRKPHGRKSHQGEFRSEDPNEPVIPAGVLAEDLDPEARRALSTLSGFNQEIVARHLVTAGQIIDVDPELAYQHAQSAVKRAGRVDVVREAAALTAYASGRYEEALREVRAVRRMRGDNSLRAIEADCERGLGRPEKAIEIVEATDMTSVSLSEQVELVLVSAGARADLGQTEYSLMVVEKALDAMPEDAPAHLLARLMELQAERLTDLGRTEEAEIILASMPEEPEAMEIVDLDEMLDADVDNLRTDLRGTSQPLNEEFDAALLDLDGVAYHGDMVQPGGPEALSAAMDAGMILGFVTNNASRSPEEVAHKLVSMGYEADADQVMTAATDLMIDLKETLEPGSKVLVVGAVSLVKQVKEAGFEPVGDARGHVDAVVQGFGSNVDWTMLSEAAYAIDAGAQYFATNMDAT